MAPSSKPNPKRVLSLTDHLEELRVRIIIILAELIPCFLVGLYFSPSLLALLSTPLTHMERTTLQAPPPVFALQTDGTLRLKEPSQLLQLMSEHDRGSTSAKVQMRELLENMKGRSAQIEMPEGTRISLGSGRSSTTLYYLSPVEPFLLIIKGALLIASIVMVPLTVYQLWLFIAPGMRRRERHIVKPVLLSAFLLFPLGAGFAYFISHFALRALLAFGDSIEGWQPNIVASSYLGFILTLMLAFGLIFQFPLVLVLLNRMGFVSVQTLTEKRRYAILLISVIAAIFTPPDPFSMLAGIIPLILLYEISLWIIRIFDRRDRNNALIARP